MIDSLTEAEAEALAEARAALAALAVAAETTAAYIGAAKAWHTLADTYGYPEAEAAE